MRFLAMAFLFLLPAYAQAFDEKPTLRDMRTEFRHGDRVDTAVRTDHAIGAMVKLATFRLREQGERDLATKIDLDWSEHFSGQLVKFVSGEEDLGDHAAWSFWIEALYIVLEAQLGTTTMEFLHLDDLHIVNLAVPVVFHLSMIGTDVIDEAEYGKHFEPLAGVMAYWGTWIACEGVTMATGWFLVCTPAGMAAELVTVNYIAPRFTPMMYARFFPAGDDVTLMSCGCDCDGCDCGCEAGEDCDCCEDTMAANSQEDSYVEVLPTIGAGM